jgi:hypothetical protein
VNLRTTRPEQRTQLTLKQPALDTLLRRENHRFTHFLPVGAIFVTATHGISPMKSRTLRNAPPEEKELSLLCNVNGWSNETYNSINWTCL